MKIMKKSATALALTIGALGFASAASACSGNGCYTSPSTTYVGGGVYSDIAGGAKSRGTGSANTNGDVTERILFSDGIDRVELFSTVEENSCVGCLNNPETGEPGNRVLLRGVTQSDRVTGAYLESTGSQIEVNSETVGVGTIRGYGGTYRINQ